MSVSHRKTLGVSADATAVDIKKARARIAAECQEASLSGDQAARDAATARWQAANAAHDALVRKDGTVKRRATSAPRKPKPKKPKERSVTINGTTITESQARWQEINLAYQFNNLVHDWYDRRNARRMNVAVFGGAPLLAVMSFMIPQKEIGAMAAIVSFALVLGRVMYNYLQGPFSPTLDRDLMDTHKVHGEWAQFRKKHFP